jgi:hypothetical protein
MLTFILFVVCLYLLITLVIPMIGLITGASVAEKERKNAARARALRRLPSEVLARDKRNRDLAVLVVLVIFAVLATVEIIGFM